MQESYYAAEVESQAQQYWQQNQSFAASETTDPNQEKFYSLCMFPYPSGHLHVGHVRNYTIGDVIARYQMMQGKNVLQPMGWDAFGLPAENAAIQHQVPPAEWTYQNIQSMRQQFDRLGLGYDWQREVTTCRPEYYRWEQWLFLHMYRQGLVYRKNAVVNWDPVDQTVLANEQVVDGRGWRSGALIERREIPQWFIKITDYADELLDGLQQLDGWPEQVRTMQRNWIGRSHGVEIHFPVVGQDSQLTVFTTRPDTLYGVSYLAISPQHPLAQQVKENNPQIQQFIDACSNIKVAEAEIAKLEKQGVDTGLMAQHPLTQQAIPIWIANFVIMEYGSGAVMSVPAHDQRDFEFAQKYQLPILPVVQPADGSHWDNQQAAFTEHGMLINSEQFTQQSSAQAMQNIAVYLTEHKLGTSKTTYRLRDWGISRQRYWGTPIPMIHCDACGVVPVPEAQLPVVLPEKVDFSGAQSPLKHIPEFYQVACPECGQAAHRETDTFDTFMESSWYYARYASFDQQQAMLDERANYWTPVDQYVGGIEHAVMHLLYARFIHKVMRDAGLVNSDEPFTHLLTQGMVLKDGAKMSKSKGNTVDPQALMDEYGADTLRLFSMFAAPPEQSLEWSDQGVEGCYRFLKRLWTFAYRNQVIVRNYNKTALDSLVEIDWDMVPDTQGSELKLLRNAYKSIYLSLQKALHDFTNKQFNTVVSAAMKILNTLHEIADLKVEVEIHNRVITEGLSIILRLLAPITPHITHVLWQQLHFGENILQAPMPTVFASALATDEVELVVQINGKLRAKMHVAANADQQSIEAQARSLPSLQAYFEGKTCHKVIVVPNKLINMVLK
jgi:leucyl-tRNA synthetase